jgi:hypothetical protein
MPSPSVGIVVRTAVIFQPDKVSIPNKFTAFESIPTSMTIVIDQKYPAAIAPVTYTYSFAHLSFSSVDVDPDVRPLD